MESLLAAKSTASEALQAAQDKAQELDSVASQVAQAAARAQAKAARLAKVAAEVRAAADAAQTKAEEISQKAAVAERVTTAEGRAALTQDKLAETKHRVPPRARKGPANAQLLQAVRWRPVGTQTGAPPAEAPVPPPQPHPQKRPASRALAGGFEVHV